MIAIDKYACFSGLKDVGPTLKILFGGMSLLACIGSWSQFSHGIIFCTMAFVTIVKGKIPPGYYAKLLLLPVGFLSIGLLGIVIDVSKTPIPAGTLWSANVFATNIYVTLSGMQLAASLAGKSLSAVSCLYFIILTTPVRDIVYFMQKMKCPQTIVTLSTLIYQSVFILLDVAEVKMKSQRCRGGFRGISRFARDFALLWGSVFVQAWLKSETVFKSMQARGYDGHLRFMPQPDRIRPMEAAGLLAFLAIVIAANFVTLNP